MGSYDEGEGTYLTAMGATTVLRGTRAPRLLMHYFTGSTGTFEQ